MQRFTILDLFCGAGGLSYGFHHAGYALIHAVDHDPDTVATYSANLGTHVYESNLAETAHSELPEADVIIGGPPCQGFSSAGLRRNGDSRNSLISTFADIIAAKKPRAFVFENVEGFLTAENGNHVFELLTPLIHAGYRIHLRKINAANYGVPQHRKRVIAIGGLGWNPTFPEPTHSAFGAPGAALAARHLPTTPTLMQALAGLPSPAAALPGDPQGHFYKPLQGTELERALSLEQGQTMRDLPQELQHSSYQRRASRRVMDGTPTERRGGAPSGIRRLKADEPSKTITGSAISEFLHPIEHRTLTIRECARIQTFPDDFIFCGSVSSQMQLIGNAVPPLLARIIADNLAHDLRNAVQQFDSGKLLSFVPTLSDGRSPALQRITNQIISTFGVGEVHPQQSLPWD